MTVQLYSRRVSKLGVNKLITSGTDFLGNDISTFKITISARAVFYLDITAISGTLNLVIENTPTLSQIAKEVYNNNFTSVGQYVIPVTDIGRFFTNLISVSGGTASYSLSVILAEASSSALNDASLSSIDSKFSSNVASVTSVSSSITNVTLLAANLGRKGTILYNDSTEDCYVKFGITASSSSFTIKMTSRSTFIIDSNPIYTGRVDAIWTAANGAMRITELT